jgi:hypothetical protein
MPPGTAGAGPDGNLLAYREVGTCQGTARCLPRQWVTGQNAASKPEEGEAKRRSSMAEREGFELSIPLRVCLISSQEMGLSHRIAQWRTGFVSVSDFRGYAVWLWRRVLHIRAQKSPTNSHQKSHRDLESNVRAEWNLLIAVSKSFQWRHQTMGGHWEGLLAASTRAVL